MNTLNYFDFDFEAQPINAGQFAWCVIVSSKQDKRETMCISRYNFMTMSNAQSSYYSDHHSIHIKYAMQINIVIGQIALTWHYMWKSWESTITLTVTFSWILVHEKNIMHITIFTCTKGLNLGLKEHNK